jgi:class 3 adenylate cyclase
MTSSAKSRQGPGQPPAPASDAHALSDQVQAILRFPDQNPNPVMRIDDEGRLLYANPASDAIRRALGVDVGDVLPGGVLARLRRESAAPQPAPIELVHDHRTYAVLAVAVPDLGFVNLYGTDITALKAIDKFPDQNPNPVLRVTLDGLLIYANRASAPIVEAQGLTVGDVVPRALMDEVDARLRSDEQTSIELACGDRIYEVLPVDVPEFGFVNLYGTDVTAARQIADAHREIERLLLNVLPPPIAERLRSGERVIADRFDDVTLLIADIVGFTGMSSRMSATEVVEMLNGIFTACDELVDRHGLEKVKTIGDAYMIVGGIPTRLDDHVERAADLALELCAMVDGMQSGTEQAVSLRIGVHCGPAVAGVIGTKKFIYDVWGDTVNMASRMESLGTPGRVHVSQAVRDRLADRYLFEPRGVLEVKGKGPQQTWYLVGRAG